jgi:hypothetical protein
MARSPDLAFTRGGWGISVERLAFTVGPFGQGFERFGL